MIIIYAILTAAAMIAAYRAGLHDFRAKDAERKILQPFRRHFRESGADSRYRDILENIERYDGTNKNQKEIKDDKR